MDIRQEIGFVTGKIQARKIAAYIGNGQEKFDALMPYASAAFCSRGSKVLRELEKKPS